MSSPGYRNCNLTNALADRIVLAIARGETFATSVDQFVRRCVEFGLAGLATPEATPQRWAERQLFLDLMARAGNAPRSKAVYVDPKDPANWHRLALLLQLKTPIEGGSRWPWTVP